jgi:hypothetical protein
MLLLQRLRTTEVEMAQLVQTRVRQEMSLNKAFSALQQAFPNFQKVCWKDMLCCPD